MPPPAAHPPGLKADAVLSAYRRYARVYDAIFGATLHRGRHVVLDTLGCQPGERVLEVGVGTGLSLPLYPADCRVVGIDVSAPMLARARTRVERLGLGNVEALLEMDAQAMTFPDASFDKVAAMYVAPVVPHPLRLVSELRRVCKPGGRIVLVNHARSDNPVLAAFEKALAPLAGLIGFRPDFELAELGEGAHGVEQVASVNVLWKVCLIRA